jgi:HK97 family phage major capsid protein
MKTAKNPDGQSQTGPENDPRSYREAELTVETRKDENGETKTTVRVSVSSETPYLRHSLWDAEQEAYVKGYEVLGHKDGEIEDSRMKDGLVIQDTHWGDQIGIIRKPEVKDGKLGGEIEFGCGERAQEIAKDAAAGIRRNMSVGYLVGERKKVGKAEDGLPIFRVTKWTPYEASFVNVPADTQVGVGRSQENPTAAKPLGRKHMDPEKVTYSAAEVTEAYRLASAAHMNNAEVRAMLDEGKPFGEVKEALLTKLEAYQKELAAKTVKPDTPNRREFDEGEEREIKKRFDIMKAIRALCAEKGQAVGDVDAGFEREISAEIGKFRGKVAQGIYIPDFIRAAGSETLGRPPTGTLDGIGGNGQATIATNLMSGSLIEALRDTLVLRERCGAQVLAGLTGNIAIPKSGKLTASWISQEGGDATKTNPTFGQISATPHSLGGYVDITRQLLIQSSLDVQAFCVAELVYAIAACLEGAAFSGTGTDGQPTGLVSQITQTAAWSNAPTFDKIVALIALARKANSYNASFRFVGDTDVWSKLATTRDYEVIQNIAGSENVAVAGGATRLLDVATDKVLGREFVESHFAPAKKLVFGDFSQLVFALWSGTDLVVDPYSNCTKGAIRIVALQDADILVRRPESFALATGVHA